MCFFPHLQNAAAAKLLQSCLTLCDPIDGSLPGSLSPGFSRQEHWSGLPFPSPMHESEKWKWSHSVMSDYATPWTAAYQAPPSMGFSRQEYWSQLPCLLPCRMELTKTSFPEKKFHWSLCIHYFFNYISLSLDVLSRCFLHSFKNALLLGTIPHFPLNTIKVLPWITDGNWLYWVHVNNKKVIFIWDILI